MAKLVLQSIHTFQIFIYLFAWELSIISLQLQNDVFKYGVFFLIQSHLNELRIVNNAAVQVRVVEPIGLVSVSQSEHVGSKLKCLFFAAGLGQVDAQPT